MSANSFEDMDGFNKAMEEGRITYRLRHDDRQNVHFVIALQGDGKEIPTGFVTAPGTPLEGVLEMGLAYVSGALAGARLSPMIQG
ncbi:hypothetical protein [Azospirillum thermophilum]|uniref:Uncharacterized protein n=1 Tax=Azospirillum thermophilum TaxID=2202148 RepID=A0A2S2CTF2_9PROT|nr:hypothetical protein [Azospirillum thermophilum]AWK87660.1 hypothetical protein DEW08_16850 [Azospirillum thermophilum]